MSKKKSKQAKKSVSEGGIASFTVPCQYCGEKNFVVREFAALGRLTAICQTCQGTEAVSFLDA